MKLTTVQESRIQSVLVDFPQQSAYRKCCFFVSTDVERLQSVGQLITNWYAWPVLQVGANLSAKLLHTPVYERPRAAIAVFTEFANASVPGPLICTGIDLLFEPLLKLDPLRLLLEVSRTTALIVLWPGSFANGRLSYATAQPHHAHYRVWQRIDLPFENVLVV